MAYTPNRRGWAEYVQGEEIRRLVLAVAERAKAYAQTISPHSEDGRGVPYADSFEIETYTDARFRSGPRVAARVVNRAGHAAAVEWGNRQNGGNGQRVLGRTLDHLGGQGG